MNDFYVPPKISIELTDKCNLRCIHCFRNSGIENTKSYISLQLFNTIIRKCAEANVKYISYTGGEPFFNNRIFEVIEKTSYYKIPFSISTNGYRNLNDYTDFFKVHKPSSIQVSLDGDEAAHNYIRKNDNAYQHLCEFLCWAKKVGIKCKVQFTAMPANIESMIFLMDFLQKYSIDSMHIAVVLPVGRYNSMPTLTYEQLVYVNAIKEEIKERSQIKITSTLFDRRKLFRYVEICIKNINHFILPIIKQNGFLHPYWGLSESWDIHDVQQYGIGFSNSLLSASYMVLKKAIQESLNALQSQEIIDFNSFVYANYQKMEGETKGC